jgi:diguanylate cyclase (GGDEF)-like protein
MRQLRLTGAGRVWLLNLALTGSCVAVVGIWLRSLPAAGLQPGIPWWLLAFAFAASEIWVVHFHFRRDAHSISLSEIPLVLGLFFVSPLQLVIAQAVGTAASLALYRRQPPIKLLFNVSNLSLQTALAALVFHLLVGSTPRFGTVTWFSTFVAVAMVSALGVVAIVTVISLSEGEIHAGKLGQAMTVGLIGALTNCSLALIAVIVIARDASSAWLLLVPASALVLAYRAYVSEREKGQSIEFLYESSHLLHGSHELEEGMLLLLSRIRGVFRADIAEITLLPSSGEPQVFRTAAGPGEVRTTLTLMKADGLDQLIATGKAGDAVLIRAPDQAAAPRAYLAARGMVDAMAVQLRGDSRVFGVMLVANRLGDVSTFNREDLKLFETLASQVSFSLENGRLEHSLVQLRKLEAELKHMAFHDPLTQLANRALFTDRIAHALARRQHPDSQIALLFVDLDDFKTVNDSLGHAAGDQLLFAVAERLRACLRPEDTAARLGGDEFGVLLETVADVNEAAVVAERITDSMRTPFRLNDDDVHVHMSAGIVIGRPGESTPDELVRKADLAMYAAKTQGKNRYQVFEASMQETVSGRHVLKVDLVRAVERGELAVYYQPIVRLGSSDLVGFEALARWHHPTRGLIDAGRFVPLAEESGLIGEIDNLVLERACEQARSWQLNHPVYKNLLMSVNVSARQIYEPQFVDSLLQVLRRTALDPGDLMLEITEGTMMQEPDPGQNRFLQLKEIGVKLAVDDFGTGHSSLSRLRSFPIDVVKIPKPFVDALRLGPKEFAFVKAIAKLGSTMNLQLVAEGIEDATQAEQLRQLHVTMGQGFYFGPPLEASAASRLLLERAKTPIRIA